MKSSARVVSIILLTLVSYSGYAQNDFFFSHYMFNPSYYNPAWVGTEEQAFAAAHHRTQWAGYNATFDPGSAPSTQMLSVVIPSKKIFSGFGVSMVNDRQPTLRSNQVRFQLSVKKELRGGTIHLGISPSFNIQTLDPGDFRPVEPEDFGSTESQLKPNLHAGLFFNSRKNYSIGLSVENILEPEFSFSGFDQLDYFKRNVYLLGIYEMGISRDLVFKPSILIRSPFGDIRNYSADFSAVAIYQEKMWGGLAFRRSESLSLLLGYSFLENNKLKAGYSFDYVIKDQDAKQPTSHEVFIRYNLPDLVFGGRKAVKTPRFTF